MFQKELLINGMRIVTEEIPYVNSVSLGIWVKVGSRYESIENNGISHFIEHMLFKGTKTRSAKEIANSIDKIGGQLNAFTSKECTCFYAKVLDTHFDIALDVLADMFFNSTFSGVEIDKERGVVLEEISMYEDSPEDLVHDLFSQAVWSGNSLGMSILGTEESLENIDREKIVAYFNENYIPKNIVISVVGNFKHDDVVKKIRKYFDNAAHRDSGISQIVIPSFEPKYTLKSKETEQAHLCLGFNGLDINNKAFYPMLVLNNVFGGAMSSRLFQKIREDRGLAYSVFSYPSSFEDCGLFSIYAGSKPDNLKSVAELIMEEIKKMKKAGITEEELYDSKEQLKGSYILGLESTSGRMISIGKSELLLDKIYSPQEILEKIDEVNMDSIQHIIKYLFDVDNMGAAVIGSMEKSTDIKKLFA
ncbi:MAG TPA: pitrilysin family protein [Negativicutes bacterium]|nr:pitrilysin family protein [Negativicutes bacterium]